LGIADKLAAAELIITGEGCFDESSLEGKGPGSLALRAADSGKQVRVFAGSTRPTAALPQSCTVQAITPSGTPLPQALAEAGQNLVITLRRELAAEL